MLKVAGLAWVKPVGGLLKFSSINGRLYTAVPSGPKRPVDKHPLFYKSLPGFVPGFFHAPKGLIISVKFLLIPAVHTTYNKRLFYLNFSY